MFKTFEDMPVWQEAMKVAEDVFSLTEILPKKEDYGLTSQLRRAALSISANIAEGFGRMQSKDKARFYCHARGSMAETKSSLIYGQRVGYFDGEYTRVILARIDDVWLQLNCLISSLLSEVDAQPKP